MENNPYLMAKAAAELAGTTVKTLRVYEARNLIAPLRSQSGYRQYSIEDIARIKTTRLLQQMGFSLADIAKMFIATGDDVVGMLDIQLTALNAKKRQVQAAIHYTEAARVHFSTSRSLSISDLTKLLKEHSMCKDLKGMDGLIEKHYTKEQLDNLEQRKPSAEYLEAVQAKWAAVFELANGLKNGSHSSQESVAMARQAKSLLAEFTQGDAKISASAGRVWQETMNDPKRAAQMPIDKESWDFLQKAMAALTD